MLILTKEVSALRTVGIICEYNPFHLGHKYQIKKTREITGADCVIGVMSGNYVQRGDAAIFDKRIRAAAAIRNGIDLIIELPTVMSLCGAERFAFCGVEILDALKMVDFISFGAENDNVQMLSEIAEILAKESEEYKSALSDGLKKGLSYAAARSGAVDLLLPGSEKFLSSPNNILAIEYLKALKKINSSITPLAIKRFGSGHNSLDISGGIISAGALRKLILSGRDISDYVPPSANTLYKDAKIHKTDAMSCAIIANLHKLSSDELSEIADVSEGLECKIKKELKVCRDFDELCGKVKSKRYAHSRIRRILLSSYLGIKKSDLVPPQYIKILDFNETGQKFLNKAKQNTKLPLVKNYNQIKAMQNPIAEKMWKNELIFDSIYNLF